ncbi:MAG: FAD-dependent thymidylate synthase [Endomicrobium sp.]|jgi:thymidylate synthase (FAD)|nr:FAD-dependent thymidylate synthase [Endomicrobium sp.]
MKVGLVRFTQDPEMVCALAARLCYSSSSINDILDKLTPNKVKKLLLKVISSGHHSVLEHASFTFVIENVSRALLAQLTRHRIASFSVQSQRYIKFKRNSVKFIIPETIKKNKLLLAKYNNFLKNIKVLYSEFLDANIPSEDARYILPIASATKIVLTMNVRELRHFFSLRCCNKAQWEIRDMACRMLSFTKKKSSLLFADAGPSCIRGECREVSPCDKPWTVVDFSNSNDDV